MRETGRWSGRSTSLRRRTTRCIAIQNSSTDRAPSRFKSDNCLKSKFRMCEEHAEEQLQYLSEEHHKEQIQYRWRTITVFAWRTSQRASAVCFKNTLKSNYSVCLKNVIKSKFSISEEHAEGELQFLSEEHPEEQIHPEEQTQYVWRTPRRTNTIFKNILFRSKYNMSEEHTEEQKQFGWRTLSTYSGLVQCCTWRFHLVKIHIYIHPSTQVQRLKLLNLMLSNQKGIWTYMQLISCTKTPSMYPLTCYGINFTEC